MFIIDYRWSLDAILKQKNPEAYFKKKGLVCKAPVLTQMGTFVYDPEFKSWTCDGSYSFDSESFNFDFMEKLFLFSQQERSLYESRFKNYMIQNWDGPQLIKGIYPIVNCNENGSLSISYSIENESNKGDLDYGITIDLDENYQPIGHIWFD
jgi:hypothetical protein